jgi:hypothetical protein
MSRERLQEHFSALYEGTLDAGLTQQIQRRFDSDPQLKEDYESFSLMMETLGSIGEEEIEVPSFLSSRIADRMEAAGNTKPAFSLFNWSKTLGFGAIATVAIVGSVLAIKNQNSGPVTAGVVSSSAPAQALKVLDTIEIKMVGSDAVLNYNSSGPKTLTATFYGTGQVLRKADLDGNTATYALRNTESLAAIFEVDVTGEKSDHFVVVPGSSSAFELQGEGKVSDFLKGVSAKFHKVISIQMAAAKLESTTKWDLKSDEAGAALSSVLTAKDYSISTAPDGIITVEAHN